MRSLTLFSPAKINLYLAITGRREDGFHNLVSVVAPLAFGDDLTLRPTDGENRLTCNAPGVPLDGSNLVLKAAHLFQERTGWKGGVQFHLEKRIPVGAGLGGGSSNAVAALLGLNQWTGGLLTPAELENLARSLGSDCPLFLSGKPVVMRGRGERLEPLPEAATSRLRGRRVLVFKPDVGISTPWAYRRMIERGTDYVSEQNAEAHLTHWLESGAPAESLLANNMQPAAFEKFLALPVLLERLHKVCGLHALMSGSGSACYALLADTYDEKPALAAIRDAWGHACFTEVSKIP